MALLEGKGTKLDTRWSARKCAPTPLGLLSFPAVTHLGYILFNLRNTRILVMFVYFRCFIECLCIRSSPTIEKASWLLLSHMPREMSRQRELQEGSASVPWYGLLKSMTIMTMPKKRLGVFSALASSRDACPRVGSWWPTTNSEPPSLSSTKVCLQSREGNAALRKLMKKVIRSFWLLGLHLLNSKSRHVNSKQIRGWIQCQN